MKLQRAGLLIIFLSLLQTVSLYGMFKALIEIHEQYPAISTGVVDMQYRAVIDGIPYYSGTVSYSVDGENFSYVEKGTTYHLKDGASIPIHSDGEEYFPEYRMPSPNDCFAQLPLVVFLSSFGSFLFLTGYIYDNIRKYLPHI